MLTPKEREVFFQVYALMRSVRHGEMAAINCKECIRNLFEIRLDTFKKVQLSTPRNYGNGFFLDQDAELIHQKFSLAFRAMDGLKPKEQSQWQRAWVEEAGTPLKRLQDLENRPAIYTSNELNLYLLWTITQAVILADATKVLEDWHNKSSELNRLQGQVKTLREAEMRSRLRAKGVEIEKKHRKA